LEKAGFSCQEAEYYYYQSTPEGDETVQINIRGKSIDITPSLRAYVEKKVGKIGKYFEGLDLNCQVALSVEKDRHIVEVTLPVNGWLLRGEEESEDMYSSVDLVVDKLERQIRKYKTRLNRKLRRMEKPEVQAVPDDDQQVVKIKRFTFKPMPVDEAIMQMNMLGHDFYVFTNSESEQINVLYRRRDGNYGLIQPDF
jgi:putative sigma-54 modulation protein